MFQYIWLKEIRSELYTWKSTLWLLIASLLFSFTSYLLLTDKELSLLDQTELMWLLSKIIIGVTFLIVTIDASAIITSEMENETAESLFLTPLRLKDFILGKLLASITLWFAIFVVATPYILVTSSGTHLAMAFLGYIFLLGTLGVVGLVMMIFGISFLYRSSKNTLTTSLVFLLALSIPALFSSTLKNNTVAKTFGKINPIDNIFESLDNVLVDYQRSLLENWHFIIPLLLFCILAFVFMFFSVWQFQKQGIIKSS